VILAKQFVVFLMTFNCREKLFETSPGGKKNIESAPLFQEISQKNVTTLREAVEMF